jgi:molybdopterin converting factor small subunit
VARVVLSGNLRQVTGGEAEFRIEARDVRGILKGLVARHPALEPHLEEGIAVAIDGEIHQDAWFSPVGPDSEVHIMPRIAGG